MIGKLCHTKYVFYDLEFLGDLNDGTRGCSIYEIAAVGAKQRHFQSFVDPFPGRDILPSPVQRDCFHITREFIAEHAIQPIDKVIPRFLDYLNSLVKHPKDTIVLTSHGGFRSDFLILRHAMNNCGLQWPSHIRFADTLQILRVCLPRAQTYTLSNLYRYCTRKDIPSPHSALHDTFALRHIMQHIEWKQCAVHYALHEHPLSNIRHIGAKTEIFLTNRGYNILDPSTYHILHELTAVQKTSVERYVHELYNEHTDDTTHG